MLVDLFFYACVMPMPCHSHAISDRDHCVVFNEQFPMSISNDLWCERKINKQANKIKMISMSNNSKCTHNIILMEVLINISSFEFM